VENRPFPTGSPFAEIPLMSRLDATRHVRRVEPHAFCLCRACQTARLDALDTTSSTGLTLQTCRVETLRDEPSGILAIPSFQSRSATAMIRVMVRFGQLQALGW